MSVPLLIVDAFTAEPFRGNPAAVCFVDEEADAEWMQRVAGEMNLSETAFLAPGPTQNGKSDGFSLRWFTPKVEVDLCGHATLASAFALWHEGRASHAAPIRFHTRSGVLTCVRAGDCIEMDFPTKGFLKAQAPSGLLEALGQPAKFVANCNPDYLVELESESAVRATRPDFGLLAKTEARGVIITARSDRSEFDFVSRFFAPRAGINEDPVTGSAHCGLGSYWQSLLGKSELAGHQISERGGVVRVRVGKERTWLAGQAALVLRGALV